MSTLTFLLCAVSVAWISALDQTNVIDFNESDDVLTLSLRESLIRYGFAQIKNIPNGVIDDMHNIQSEMIDFFNQPLNDKMKLYASQPWEFGYIPLNFESTNGIYDIRETFAIGKYPETRMELGLSKKDAINKWPNDMIEFQQLMENLLTKTHEFSVKIIELFCKTLNRNKDCLYKLFDQSSSEFRLTKYLSLNETNGSNQGVGEHTDSGFMAFIFQTCQGLEFYDDLNEEWINVDYHNDTIIINIGDMAKLLSNGLYLTPKHRVLLQNDVRYTVLYFFNPNYNEEIQSLLTEIQPKYQTLTWKQYLNERFNSGSYSSKKDRKNLNDFMISSKTEL